MSDIEWERKFVHGVNDGGEWVMWLGNDPHATRWCISYSKEEEVYQVRMGEDRNHLTVQYATRDLHEAIWWFVYEVGIWTDRS